MLIYYRSVDPDNLFNLQFYLGAKNVLHLELNCSASHPKRARVHKRHH